MKINDLKYDVQYGLYGEEYEDAKRRGLLDGWRNEEPDLWLVTIRHPEGREYSFPFATAEAMRRDRHHPTSQEENVFLLALSAVVKDTLIYERESSFEDFCDAMGFDPEDPKSEKIYRAVEEQARAVRELLGDDFDGIAKELEENGLL